MLAWHSPGGGAWKERGMAYEAIIYEVKDHIAYITLNRPEVMNARNRQMVAEIIAACDQVVVDGDVRAVIFSGAGERAFSTGRDLKELAGMGEVTRPAFERRDHEVVAALPKPSIAAIHGYAVGGGLELALCCDIRVATEDARLGLMEVKRGLLPGSGGMQRLPRVVGRTTALEMVLTGEPIDGREAYRIGLVNKVVPTRAELLPEAERIARLIMANAPVAVRLAKQAVTQGIELTLEQGLRLDAHLIAINSATEDAKEGPRAFAEKRQPVWKGR